MDGEPFKLFGMSPTPKNQPVFLYEQIIEPTLGYGEALLHREWIELDMKTQSLHYKCGWLPSAAKAT